MKTLIQELLNFSRIGRNRTIKKVSLNTVVEEVLHDLETTITAAGASVSVGPLPVLKLNDVEMKQLFQNLIGNALKFRSKERVPVIEISCAEKADEWIFSVKDNGIGIETEYLHKLFLLFQRLHTDGEYPGTGIGLAVCKKIVELNNGKIWVESAYGKGSTFFFSLPKTTV